jgi:hypothetical protein
MMSFTDHAIVEAAAPLDLSPKYLVTIGTR